MTWSWKRVFALLAVLLGVALGAAAFVSAQDTASPCAPVQGTPREIHTARLFIEYNAAADDLGVHGLFDDEGWAELCVFDPNGRLVLHVRPQSQLGNLGLARIFFESREPELADFDFPDLAAAFPAGTYQVVGTNFDGTSLTGAAWFMHNVPAKPVIVAPTLVSDIDRAGDVVLPMDGLVVEWQPVTLTVDGNPVTITGYEVIVTSLVEGFPHSFANPVYDVHLPPDRTRLMVPLDFLQPGTGYEIEVLALEESGNQTIAGGYFTTAQ